MPRAKYSDFTLNQLVIEQNRYILYDCINNDHNDKKNCFCCVIAYDPHSFVRAHARKSGVSLIHHFVNESLRFIIIIAVLISSKWMRINQRQINRRRNETNLQSRENFALFPFLAHLVSTSTMGLSCVWKFHRLYECTRNVSCEPVSFFSRSGSHVNASSKILNVIAIIRNSYMRVTCITIFFFTTCEKYMDINHGHVVSPAFRV